MLEKIPARQEGFLGFLLKKQQEQLKNSLFGWLSCFFLLKERYTCYDWSP